MSVALQTDMGEGVWYVTFAPYNLLDEEIDLKIRKISDQTEGGELGWYLEGRGGGRKECRGQTKMGGRSCKPSGVLDPVIPAGVLGPEAGDVVRNSFGCWWVVQTSVASPYLL